MAIAEFGVNNVSPKFVVAVSVNGEGLLDSVWYIEACVVKIINIMVNTQAWSFMLPDSGTGLFLLHKRR